MTVTGAKSCVPWQSTETLKLKAPGSSGRREYPLDETLDEWWKTWWSKERKEGIGWLAAKLGYKAHRLEYATLSAFVHSSPALADFYFHQPKHGAGAILETRPGISDENRDFVDLVVFSVFAAFVDTCAAFAKQMEFGFEDD